ncbi:hypothetical protein SAMN04488074_11911 [Lentzea albidocapillata subsp. violacea]|uniref:Uncharacterized protein n=1 Tax=Lentzea albidocapillata subsp. violacea TaxID=128104 RepID=A0A1G9RTN5_9PSEU|nr:hypothetical protein [Lentzea albidocapillata]SDM26543.1 hypothetical protein SAMN04488074_11911 [Lentzea albidocapillata subsp. violacea]
MNESPVRYGSFSSGTEPVLWRPGLARERLCRRAVWRCLLPDAGLYALGGVVTLLIGVANRPMLVLVVAAGAVLVVVAVLIARYDYLRFGHDLSARTAAWRTDRGRGEWYFRSTDFLDRGPLAAAALAAQVIDAVHLSHSGPAAPWIGQGHLDAVHRLAWDMLLALYQAPTAHDDLQPVIARLTLATAHIREANRRLHHAAATTRTDDLLAHLTALHDVLPAAVTP